MNKLNFFIVQVDQKDNHVAWHLVVFDGQISGADLSC